MQVREDVKTLERSTVLVGMVSTPLSHQNLPVVVAAYSKGDRTRSIIHYTILHEPGPYELMVPAGTHNIVAFGDENRNLTYDPGEPAGQILSAEQVAVPAGGVSGNLDIVLAEQAVDLPVGFKMPSKEHTRFHSTAPGALADIDEYVFSAEYGQMGLWDSLVFFREAGGNVYFLEPYDPAKIPILFVHGASGSPQDWRTFFERIDRSRYQPWFYYYPSGSSIDSMSHLLFWKLQNLQMKYHFDTLYITAHSMGGLVVRSFLVNYGTMFPCIRSFISISTPWGGEELAELGVKYSPGVVPAWRDMQPCSEFISSIFSKDLPPSVDYYLFFGHKGNRNIFRANNDKAVTLASQLDQRSQREAKMIYGFNEDHVSILSSREVTDQYNAILSDSDQRGLGANRAEGNKLFVKFAFDAPEGLPRPVSGLYLHPVGQEGAETWIYLSQEGEGKTYGPFASGDYEASILAPAFVPHPARVPVRIEEGKVPEIQFSMKPAGCIRGFIADQGQKHMQAGKNRQPDADVEIQSVVLSGSGIKRTVIPLQGVDSYDALLPEHYLSGTDYSARGAFFFFDLPDGSYELTVNAEGCKSMTRKCNVKAGHYQDIMIFELESCP